MSGLPARASPRLRVETGPVGSPAAYLVDARVWNVVLLRLQNRAGQRSPFPPASPGGRSGCGCIPTSPSHGGGLGGGPTRQGLGQAELIECWQAGPPSAWGKGGSLPPQKTHLWTGGPQCMGMLGGLVTQTAVPHPQSF